MEGRPALQYFRVTLLVTSALALGALVQLGVLAARNGILLTSWKWQLLLGTLAGGIFGLCAVFLVSLGSSPARLQRLLAAGARFHLRGRAISLGVYLLLLPVLPLLVMGPTGRYLENLFPRLLIFWILSLAGAGLLAASWPASSRAFHLAASALLLAFAYQITLFRPALSTYPLSLGWSEISRYYYGSLFLSEKIYGLQVPPSVLHPSRYLLQAIPFLLNDSPLWLHRLWQVLLRLGLTMLSAGLLARRLHLPRRGASLLVMLWAFLFFFQGPILYHLLVSVILVLGGFQSERFWRSSLAILLASFWAGISRLNWLPVPAFLGATLYFLERPVPVRSAQDFRVAPLWRYLRAPVIWVAAGSITALAAQSIYILWSGNAADQFGSSLTSDLLWYRLLPSATYPMGVVPAILLVSLPLLTLIALYLYSHWHHHHPVRLLGLAVMGFVLFSGGVVVSTKIGGGSNLHNLDSFLLLLIVAGSYIHAGRFARTPMAPDAPFDVPWWLRAWIVTVPILFTLSAGGPFSSPDFIQAREVIETIKEAIADYGQDDEEVLFISERHLITFNMIDNVPLVPEYEKVFLMEMAMSGNPGYLSGFREDLQTGRFSLIVSHPLKIQYQGRARPFGEENDAWVRQVSEPVLCHYEPLVTYRDPGVQLLVPRTEREACP